MLFVAVSLFLRALLYLVDMTVVYYSHNRTIEDNLDWATNYIYDISTMGIYLGVTAVALIGSYRDPMPKHDPSIELAPFAQPHVY
jgi:hypothetical protein